MIHAFELYLIKALKQVPKSFWRAYTKDDLLYLHRKAAENGFWNFPEVLENTSAKNQKVNSPHYYIEYKYKDKTKHVLYDAAYTDNPKLGDAAKQLSKEISSMINDAQDRQ